MEEEKEERKIQISRQMQISMETAPDFRLERRTEEAMNRYGFTKLKNVYCIVFYLRFFFSEVW